MTAYHCKRLWERLGYTVEPELNKMGQSARTHCDTGTLRERDSCSMWPPIPQFLTALSHLPPCRRILIVAIVGEGSKVILRRVAQRLEGSEDGILGSPHLWLTQPKLQQPLASSSRKLRHRRPRRCPPMGAPPSQIHTRRPQTHNVTRRFPYHVSVDAVGEQVIATAAITVQPGAQRTMDEQQ